MVIHVTSPYAATGLINGVAYSFVMNGRKGNGPAGSNTAVVSATPSLAGANWQVSANLGSADMHGIAFGGFTANTVNARGVPIGYYVAVGNNGVINKSSDGVNWETVSSPTGSNLNAAIFAQNNFIAAGASGSILYSLDTVTWTAAANIPSQTLNALADNAGLQKCFGALVGTVIPSVDYFAPQSGCGFWGSRANNASLIVAVGDAGTILYSTNGGVTWTAATSPSANNLYGVAYSPGIGTWVAVGAGGTLISSTNAGTWTTVSSPTTSDLNSIAVLASTNAATLLTTYTFVAVGAGGTILTSNDAVTWTSRPMNPPAPNLNAVTGWSQIVAVGAGGSMFTSRDGANWTPVTSNTTATLYGVIGAAGQYNAIGQAGTSIYSQ